MHIVAKIVLTLCKSGTEIDIPFSFTFKRVTKKVSTPLIRSGTNGTQILLVAFARNAKLSPSRLKKIFYLCICFLEILLKLKQCEKFIRI